MGGEEKKPARAAATQDWVRRYVGTRIEAAEEKGAEEAERRLRVLEDRFRVANEYAMETRRMLNENNPPLHSEIMRDVINIRSRLDRLEGQLDGKSRQVEDGAIYTRPSRDLVTMNADLNRLVREVLGQQAFIEAQQETIQELQALLASHTKALAGQGVQIDQVAWKAEGFMQIVQKIDRALLRELQERVTRPVSPVDMPKPGDAVQFSSDPGVTFTAGEAVTGESQLPPLKGEVHFFEPAATPLTETPPKMQPGMWKANVPLAPKVGDTFTATWKTVTNQGVGNQPQRWKLTRHQLIELRTCGVPIVWSPPGKHEWRRADPGEGIPFPADLKIGVAWLSHVQLRRALDVGVQLQWRSDPLLPDSAWIDVPPGMWEIADGDAALQYRIDPTYLNGGTAQLFTDEG